jgi:hypothetical protein
MINSALSDEKRHQSEEALNVPDQPLKEALQTSQELVAGALRMLDHKALY